MENFKVTRLWINYFDSNSAFVNKMKVVCLPITTGIGDISIKQSDL